MQARTRKRIHKIVRIGCPFGSYNSEAVFAIVGGVGKNAGSLGVSGLKLNSAFIIGKPSLFANRDNRDAGATVRCDVLTDCLPWRLVDQNLTARERSWRKSSRQTLKGLSAWAAKLGV